MKWIITRHMSSMDGTIITMAKGSADEIKKHLVRLLKTDKALEKTEGHDSWNFGTEDIEDVEVDKCGTGTLYAFGAYDDFHIDYTARLLDCLPVMDCEEE